MSSSKRDKIVAYVSSALAAIVMGVVAGLFGAPDWAIFLGTIIVFQILRIGDRQEGKA